MWVRNLDRTYLGSWFRISRGYIPSAGQMHSCVEDQLRKDHPYGPSGCGKKSPPCRCEAKVTVFFSPVRREPPSSPRMCSISCFMNLFIGLLQQAAGEKREKRGEKRREGGRGGSEGERAEGSHQGQYFLPSHPPQPHLLLNVFN